MAFKTHYRTLDGKADYGFSIEQERDGNYRIYIDSQPGYGSQSTDCEDTHRLTSGNRHYVCWTGQISTIQEAKGVAADWANGTQQYIKTGQKF